MIFFIVGSIVMVCSIFYGVWKHEKMVTAVRDANIREAAEEADHVRQINTEKNRASNKVAIIEAETRRSLAIAAANASKQADPMLRDMRIGGRVGEMTRIDTPDVQSFLVGQDQSVPFSVVRAIIYDWENFNRDRVLGSLREKGIEVRNDVYTNALQLLREWGALGEGNERNVDQNMALLLFSRNRSELLFGAADIKNPPTPNMVEEDKSLLGT
jgi:hypothetical protein